MVKRLRRRPLTAKTGVRVPMEVPQISTGSKAAGGYFCALREPFPRHPVPRRLFHGESQEDRGFRFLSPCREIFPPPDYPDGSALVPLYFPFASCGKCGRLGHLTKLSTAQSRQRTPCYGRLAALWLVKLTILHIIFLGKTSIYCPISLKCVRPGDESVPCLHGRRARARYL